ncbi:NAD(P)H-binding protein [Hymenobacter sp. HMF4947]|uniref:NAD(P)H-binding protein n=1 Tax=Hymenobacter ginkgonis TaxID=2682976 RepID=A0A7K1TJY8_9BACT|nr:SDR family oxidoreductase [Hymenobacter ginkgonis]MVN78720.1 NAD(P)H-binding protein [Hymenobacter ginkgonis]
MSKILVTGATGGLGKAVVENLLKTVGADQISVLVRDPAKAADLQARGVTVRKGDYADYDSLTAAFAGIDKLLLVSGNDITQRVPQHTNVLKAAAAAGVQHLVYTSAQRKTEDGSSAVAFVTEAHLATEKLLKASGLTYTILKNALYLDVLPQFMGPALEIGTIYLPAGEGRGSFASRADMGAACAAVLTGTGHENQSYEIASNESLSFADIAKILSDLSGKEVHYVSPTAEEFGTQLAQAGVPAEGIQMAAGFSVAIAQGEFDLPSSTLEKLLGHKPESAADFLKAAYQL